MTTSSRRAIFARHHPRNNTFVWNILILGTLAFVRSLFVSYELTSVGMVFWSLRRLCCRESRYQPRQFYFLGFADKGSRCCLTSSRQD